MNPAMRKVWQKGGDRFLTPMSSRLAHIKSASTLVEWWNVWES